MKTSEDPTSKSGQSIRMDPSVTATQKSIDASPKQSRNMLTPHLQSTNVKIALQKEKSKRMIQILQQSSK